MQGTNELIARAFSSRPRAENLRLLEVVCLDEHLQGHAFKYATTSSRIQGVYRYRLTYAVGGSDGERSVDVMVKAKPDEADIIRVYRGYLITPGSSCAGRCRSCCAIPITASRT